jgi:hypothetical protein
MVADETQMRTVDCDEQLTGDTFCELRAQCIAILNHKTLYDSERFYIQKLQCFHAMTNESKSSSRVLESLVCHEVGKN